MRDPARRTRSSHSRPGRPPRLLMRHRVAIAGQIFSDISAVPSGLIFLRNVSSSARPGEIDRAGRPVNE